jgi:hypothetical protein
MFIFLSAAVSAAFVTCATPVGAPASPRTSNARGVHIGVLGATRRPFAGMPDRLSVPRISQTAGVIASSPLPGGLSVTLGTLKLGTRTPEQFSWNPPPPGPSAFDDLTEYRFIHGNANSCAKPCCEP